MTYQGGCSDTAGVSRSLYSGYPRCGSHIVHRTTYSRGLAGLHMNWNKIEIYD